MQLVGNQLKPWAFLSMVRRLCEAHTGTAPTPGTLWSVRRLEASKLAVRLCAGGCCVISGPALCSDSSQDLHATEGLPARNTRK